MNTQNEKDIPILDDMLQPLLLIEEGEHEFSSEDEHLDELRQLFFPVTRECIYLNHAVAGPLPQPVVRAIQDYVDDVSRFGASHEERWQQYRDGVHRRLASLLHARPEQVAFTANAHDSLRRLLSGLDWHEGDTFLVGEDESIGLASLKVYLQTLGVKVQTIAVHDQHFATEEILAQIDEHTRLVHVSHVVLATGARNDIAALAAYCHERAILFGVDCTQSLGILDVNVQQTPADYIVAEGHRWLLAPQVCGIIYVATTLHAHLRQTAEILQEQGVPNSLPIVGLDAALGVFESLAGDMPAVAARVLGLGTYVIAGLERFGYPVISPLEPAKRGGSIYFSAHPERQDLTVQDITAALVEQKIYIAAWDHVASISPHFYNTTEELDALFTVLEGLKMPAIQ